MSDEEESGVTTGWLNEDGELIDEETDYFQIEVALDDDTIEGLQNGSGVVYEFGDGEDGHVGVAIDPVDKSGFSEYAFQKHVEREYGFGTYLIDRAYRAVQTREFAVRFAAYAAAFLSAPFLLQGAGEAVAFTYGVVVVLLLPMLFDAVGMESAWKAADSNGGDSA